MNFQFYCPQGHLLQGDTAHAGSAIVCPVCGIQFIIPQAVAPVTPVVQVVQPVAPSAATVVAAETDEEPEFELDAGTPQFTAPSSKAKKKTPLDDILADKKEEAKPKAETEVEPDLGEDSGNAFDVFGDGVGLNDEAVDNGTFGRKAKDLDILHIPCPRGHVLEVPQDMIGERVRCPYCKAVYTLQFERSLEARKEQAERDAVEEARLGKIWLMRAMIFGIIAFLFIVLMLALG